MQGDRHYQAIVIGASAGGMSVIKDLIRALPENCLPVIVVQHMADLHEGPWIEHLCTLGRIRVKEADEKEPICRGIVYLAPGNYHLLVEPDHTFSLSTDHRVNFARPSVNVLFETAAEAYGSALIGVVLSGGNSDGADGAMHIRSRGGLVLVQDPSTAEAPSMPEAAIGQARPQLVLSPEELIQLLVTESRSPFDPE